MSSGKRPKQPQSHHPEPRDAVSTGRTASTPEEGSPIQGTQPDALPSANQVRLLISKGDTRSALNRVKALYKAVANEASQGLLLEAYAARIMDLSEKGLTAEDAKKRLGFEPFVRIREEALASPDGTPLHLETELSREEFEAMISPLIESTLECVSKAMTDASVKPGDLDAILLVGGSTRIPMVQKAIEERAGIAPRHEIHPDLCVALGAGVLAARLRGHEVGRVLVDVTPYSFGPSYLGERDGLPYPYCYHPIIRANTALPVTRTDKYFTVRPFQKEVTIGIYQGEDPDALKNIPVGSFEVSGLNTGEEPNTILCRMSLDIDGILTVTGIEKETGKSKAITIRNALKPMSEGEPATARKRLHAMYKGRAADMGEMDDAETETSVEGGACHGNVIPFPGADRQRQEPASADSDGREGEADARESSDTWPQMRRRAERLLERSRAVLNRMHEEDKEEAIDLHDRIDTALSSKAPDLLEEACLELNELLFFVEGK